MNSSKVSKTMKVDTNKTSAPELIGGATGQITKAISERRSHRHQWRIFEIISILILDAALIDLSFQLAYHLRFNILGNSSPILAFFRNNVFGNPNSSFPIPSLVSFIPVRVSIVVGLIIIFTARRFYHLRLTGSWFSQVWHIITGSTMGVAILITYYLAFQPPSNSRLLVLFFWATSIIVLCFGRLITSGIMGMLYRAGFGETRLLVVGSGRLSKMIMQHIVASPNLGYSIVGFLHDMNEPPSDFGRFKMLGTLEDIGLVIRSMQIDEVIIALPSRMNQHAIRAVKMCERLGTTFKLVPDLYELRLSRIDMETIEGIPLISIKQISLNSIQRFITRVVDISVSTIVLVLGSPLWLCIALLIRFSSQGPTIFKQTRIGLKGQPFQLQKFRSMYKDADQRLAVLMSKNEAKGPLFKMKEDPRITPIGKFLRRTSLDEIPQLINVLKGEMSLVGPRPSLPREVAQYEEWQKGRLGIKPGLTGLWQVRGRSDISFDEGVLLDLYYIENWSLRLYFQTLLRTVPAVLLSKGAY